jgi:ATP-dependent DNA ligase
MRKFSMVVALAFACDGYRMHARIDSSDIKLLTRTGLDWSHGYQRTIEALCGLDENSTEMLF